MIRLRTMMLISAALIGLSTCPAFGQTGTMTGQILDLSGAAVSNARVTATSESTGFTTVVTSTSAGVYNLAALPPSVYTVTVSAEGFQQIVRKSVVLNVAAILPLNFKLSVAGATVSVDVSDVAVAPIETSSFQISTVIDAKQINDLPLILRDPYQLVLLSPGTVTASNNMGGFSVNGQRDRNNNFMLDGADNNDSSVPGGQGGISSANPDSAQEFRVITNNFDAEFGRNTGAIIDVVTRGGGNQFHGDAYEFGRYNALGARDYFNTKTNGKQDPYVRNDFGASVGGPLWRDHTFFFLNGEVQRFRTTRTESQTVPTAAYKSGNFTYIDPVDGRMTSVNLSSGAANPANQTGLGPDPVITKILAITPAGQAGNGDGVSATYFYPSGNALNAYSLTGRFDQKLTNRHQLTLRYVYGHSAENDPFHDEVLPGYGNTAAITTTHNGVISVASALSPRTTNLFRGGYNQNNSGYFCNHAGIDALTGVDAFGNGRDIALPGFFTLGCVDLGGSNGQARLSSTITMADTFSVNKGAHSMKFGGEFHSVKDNGFDNFYSREQVSLNDYSTYGADAYTFAGNAKSPSYNSFQDLVFGRQGVVANTTEYQFFTGKLTRRGNDVTRFRQHEWAAFAQDTWKVNPRLTFIYGGRYAFNGVPYEKDANFSNFYGNAAAPLAANQVFTFTSVGPGTGRQLYADSWKLFEPRVGFSYDVGGKGTTAIRGGFGIFHDRIFDNLFGNAKSNPPYQAQTNDYPFDGTIKTPTASTTTSPGTLTPSASIGNGALNEPFVIDPQLKMPTNQTYNLGIQHQFGKATLEVNYVGSHGTNILRDVDGAPPQPALVERLLASGVKASNLQRDALYTSYPATYNTAFYHELLQTSIGGSNYNGLQLKITGQVGGLQLTSSYTYSHSLDDSSDPLAPGAGNSGLPRNSFDLLPEYGNSPFDVRHRGTVAASYNLPIGHGGRILQDGFMSRVFEGIEISGIQQVQSGLPFDLRGTVDNLHTGLNNRPALVGAPYPSGRGSKTAQGVITGPARSAFANPAFDQNVSLHRNKFYGPGFVNTDVVLQKTQTLYEQVKLVFRAESYNVLNHPNFTSPASDTISSPLFGISTSQVGQNDGTTGARQIQGALKLVF